MSARADMNADAAKLYDENIRQSLLSLIQSNSSVEKLGAIAAIGATVETSSSSKKLISALMQTNSQMSTRKRLLNLDRVFSVSIII